MTLGTFTYKLFYNVGEIKAISEFYKNVKVA